MTSSKAIKLKLIARDGAVCHYCGAALVQPTGGFTENGMSIDHIEPSAAGGSNDLDNTVLACQRCNSSKGKRHYQEFVMSRDSDQTIIFLMGVDHE